MADSPIFVTSQRLEDALAYTARLHSLQVRKGTGGVPYLSHLLGVASLVMEAGGTEDEVIAALLHDAVEDQGGNTVVEANARLDDIRQRFGGGVAEIVAFCTDSWEQPKPDWRPRKEAYIAKLHDTATPKPALLVSCADKLHNATAIRRDLRSVGDDVWSRFTGKRDGTLWYYGELAAAFNDRLGGVLPAELSRVVDELTS
jgi:(p)ppGpp synthase/HD superfamily hydrolase